MSYFFKFLIVYTIIMLSYPIVSIKVHLFENINFLFSYWKYEAPFKTNMPAMFPKSILDVQYL